jgi:hypothetical protein
MKCATHHAEAIAVCAYCGRALCPDCAKPSASQRMTCSENCATSLARNDKALQILLQKHFQGARINAIFYLLCGILSVAGAIGARFYLPSPFLIWFCAGCGFVFLASGLWQWLASRKHRQDS